MILRAAGSTGPSRRLDPEFVTDGKLGYAAFPAVTGGRGDPKNIVGNPANYWSLSSKASARRRRRRSTTSRTACYTDTYVDNLLKDGDVPPVEGIEAQARHDRRLGRTWT